MGKASFFNLQDQLGEFQCYIKEQESQKTWDLWKLTDIGDILGVKSSISAELRRAFSSSKRINNAL